MNTLKRRLIVGGLMLLVTVGSHTAIGAPQRDTTELINTTISHLEAAQKAVNANDATAAQEHVKAAGQSSKLIIGGSFEARKQGGTRAITKARIELDKGNTAAAGDAVKEALAAFKALFHPDKTGNQGGL